MSQIRKIILSGGATKSDQAFIADKVLKSKCLGTGIENGNRFVIARFDDLMDEFAFSLACGMIELTPIDIGVLDETNNDSQSSS